MNGNRITAISYVSCEDVANILRITALTVRRRAAAKDAFLDGGSEKTIICGITVDSVIAELAAALGVSYPQQKASDLLQALLSGEEQLLNANEALEILDPVDKSPQGKRRTLRRLRKIRLFGVSTTEKTIVRYLRSNVINVRSRQ